MGVFSVGDLSTEWGWGIKVSSAQPGLKAGILGGREIRQGGYLERERERGRAWRTAGSQSEVRKEACSGKRGQAGQGLREQASHGGAHCLTDCPWTEA